MPLKIDRKKRVLGSMNAKIGWNLNFWQNESSQLNFFKAEEKMTYFA